MKNQNDLIFSIVGIVVFLIVFFVCYGMKPQPTKPADPAPVNTAKVTLPTNVEPVYANALGQGGGPGGGPGAPAPGMMPGRAGKSGFGAPGPAPMPGH